MCYTCQKYPRFTLTVEDLSLCSLRLGCPEVGRMLLTREEPLAYIFSEDAEEAPPAGADTDWEVFNLFTGALSAGTALLQDRSLGIGRRQRLLLLMGRSIQDALDAGETERARQIVEIFSSPEGYASFPDSGSMRPDAKRRLLTSLSFFQTAPFNNYVKQLLSYARYGTDFRPFVLSCKALNEEPHAREQEQILVNSLCEAIMLDYPSKTLFSGVEFAVLFNQIFCTLTALASALRGEPLPLHARVLLLSYLSRFFSHDQTALAQSLADYLRESGQGELDFLFQVVG